MKNKSDNTASDNTADNSNKTAEPKKQEQSQFGMKWYKVIINFSAYAAAVISGINVIVLLLGTYYEGMRDVVYSMYPTLALIDILYAGINVFLLIYALRTRSNLYWERKKGPRMIVSLYVMNTVFSVAYIVASAVVLAFDLEEFINMIVDSDNLLTIIAGPIGAICNYIYFKKRKDIFKY